ncbi:MAG: 3-deoxy-manno-octulosonate cytidylyltransferase [Candidatus Melainabacteria bacterium]|nr:3-deoxy-manno-octulosonate cytidylyltransferase [Candidatus Melainabacteria bacterium]
MTTAIIIPARYESIRFPGKPLALISGKPMIEWVLSAAKKSKLANKIIVATEDKRIFDFVKEKLNAEACLTSKDHKCGTDRITEVVKKHPDVKYIVNLQGDEPLMPPEYIDKVLEPLLESSSIQMSSLVAPITNPEELNNPNIVKAVVDKDGFALYFSRSQIPYNRDNRKNIQYYKHIGIYAYTRETILQFSLLPQSSLEIAEQLEQLRALENGIKIKLAVVPKSYPAVDRPEDVKVVESLQLINFSSHHGLTSFLVLLYFMNSLSSILKAGFCSLAFTI